MAGVAPAPNRLVPAPVPPPKIDEVPVVEAAPGRDPNKLVEVLLAPNNDPGVLVAVFDPPPKTEPCPEENKPPPDAPAVKGELKSIEQLTIYHSSL